MVAAVAAMVAGAAMLAAAAAMLAAGVVVAVLAGLLAAEVAVASGVAGVAGASVAGGTVPAAYPGERAACAKSHDLTARLTKDVA
jgi:hypothetical protein